VATTAVAECATRPSARLVLGTVALATFFVSLSSSTLSVAVPAIVRDFGASALTATFIVLTPAAVSTSLMLIMGRAGDIVGRRAAYLAGIGGFTVASLLAGVAPTPPLLIGLQACQAVATAVIWANSAAILLDLLPADRVNHGLGIYIASISVAELIGPSVGGAIAGTAGWRWIFLLNVPVGVACFLLGRTVLRARGRPERPASVDVPGGALLLVGLAGLIVSLSLAQTSGWSAPAVFGGAAAAAALLGAFVLLELRTRDPLIDLRMFRDRPLSLAMASGFANSMAQWSPVLLMALYFQAVAGDSPIVAGLKVTPLPVCSGIAALSAGRLARRLRPDTLAVAGSAIAFLGLAILAPTIDTGYPANLIALVLIGAGGGLFGPSNTNVVMARAPRTSTGLINGTRLMLQNVGWVTSTAVVLTLVTAPLPAALRREFFAGTASQVSPAAAASLMTGYTHAIFLLAVLALAGSVTSLASRAWA
jgi:predicted MFS family arabinose efflux permease